MEQAITPEHIIYPIGKYTTPDEYNPEMQNDWISIIEAH